MIKAKHKTATLRSLKEVYPLGLNELPDGTKIEITGRTLVFVHKDRAECLDNLRKRIATNRVTQKEGS